jgi:PilZ domain
MENPADLQEVTLVPVDENGRVLLFCDLKIEKIDTDYRTIRDANGLTWKLAPGQYNVRIFLRSLQMKTVPLQVEAGVTNYQLRVPTELPESPAPNVTTEGAWWPAPPEAPKQNGETPKAQTTAPNAAPQKDAESASPQKPTDSASMKKPTESDDRKRYPVSFPVSYRTDSSDWIKTRALNVSASGLCVENVGGIIEDDNLYVRLHVPVATIPIECPARVVWVKNDPPPSSMGLQLFLTANMRDSLDRWLSGI